MKNFQKVAVALIIGVMAVGFSAFTKANKTENALVDMYWFNSNPAGTILSESSVPNIAEPLATNRTGCPSLSGSQFCGRGYTSEQTELNGSGDRILKGSTAVGSGTGVKRTP
jgi:hypothetical protein